jgi:hypothetical protein
MSRATRAGWPSIDHLRLTRRQRDALEVIRAAYPDSLTPAQLAVVLEMTFNRFGGYSREGAATTASSLVRRGHVLRVKAPGGGVAYSAHAPLGRAE